MLPHSMVVTGRSTATRRLLDRMKHPIKKRLQGIIIDGRGEVKRDLWLAVFRVSREKNSSRNFLAKFIASNNESLPLFFLSTHVMLLAIYVAYQNQRHEELFRIKWHSTFSHSFHATTHEYHKFLRETRR